MGKRRSVKKRVIAIRKTLKLNQHEFAERLGIRGTALSMIESGKNSLTEKNIKLICMTFNVNEQWLRNGTGAMFAAAASPLENELFEIYRGLMPETQQALLQLAKQLLKTQRRLARKPEKRER
jgi:transcriptional regulator with XRE-family HTH domain